jgi:hypothetical protein
MVHYQAKEYLQQYLNAQMATLARNHIAGRLWMLLDLILNVLEGDILYRRMAPTGVQMQDQIFVVC